jgi:hypothetical protein
VEKALSQVKIVDDVQQSVKSIVLYYATNIGGQSAYELRDYAGAEREMQAAMAARKYFGGHTVGDHRDQSELSCWLAMAQVRQGKIAAAAQTIGPVVSFDRGLVTRNHGDVWVSIELARALYVQALTDSSGRAAQLRQAAALLNAAPASVRELRELQRWRAKIADAQQT